MANEITNENGTIGLRNASGSFIDGLHIMSINVHPNARLISHPLESGGVTVDNKVLDPIRLTLKAYITWEDKAVVSTLYQMWRTRQAEFYSVVTHEGEYKNLAVLSIPHNELPQKFDIFEFTIQMQEVMFATGVSKVEADKSNGDTVRSGRIGGSLGW